MNRRQFLGRVFQSLISLHNSYSEYGIYHSWRQYQEMKTDVTIRFRYRTGRNPNYDPDSSGSSEYNYYNIPYTGADGPIIGIYNGDTLIYCSAYYQGTTLINTMGTSVTLKLSAGTYTIKVMRLGKGLVLGESGETMTFTIAPFDRTVNPYTGGYNAANNYGYISTPSKEIYFNFDYEGLSFDVVMDYEDLGSDLKSIDGITVSRYTFPDYATVKSAVEAAYKEFDPEGDDGRSITEEEYINTILSERDLAPYDDQIKFHTIQRGSVKLVVRHQVGFDTVDERGTVDVTELNARGIALHEAYYQAGIEYDINDSYNITWDINRKLYNSLSADASYMEYIMADNASPYLNLMHAPIVRLTNTEPFIEGNTYPLAGLYGRCDYGPVSILRTARASNRWQFIINGTTQVVNIPVLRVFFNTLPKCFTYKVRGHSSETSGTAEQFIGDRGPAPNPYRPISYVRQERLKPVAEQMSRALTALNEAVSHWDCTFDDGYDRWFEEADAVTYAYQQTTYYFDIPWGPVINPDAYDFASYPVWRYDMTKCTGFEVVPRYYDDGRFVSLYVSYHAPGMKYGGYEWSDIEVGPELYNPLPETSTIDWTGYEDARDMTTGWVNTNNGPLVLRQTTIDIDLSDVPDHQITPN